MSHPATAPVLLFFKRRGWIILCALLVSLALSVQLWLTGFFPWPHALLQTAVDTFPWLLVLPIILWLSQRFPLYGAKRFVHAGLHLIACLFFSVLLAWSAFGLLRWLGDDARPRPPPLPPSLPSGAPTQAFPPPSARPRSLWRVSLSRAPLHWAIYALLVALAHGWSLARRAHEREKHANELERLLAETQLDSLTRQLQPHFLFNTLNTIASFVRKDGAQAENLLLDLSELLRRTSRAGERPIVALHEELVLLDLYLDIQRARFGSRLQITRKIDPEALIAQVPVLLLQPLVENALLHGLDHSFSPVQIVVEASLNGEQLRLVVWDDGPGGTPASNGSGIGLRNTHARLKALYGNSASFLPRPMSGRGFMAECLLPFQPVVL